VGVIVGVLTLRAVALRLSALCPLNDLL
jgi:hypothetical protein